MNAAAAADARSAGAIAPAQRIAGLRTLFFVIGTQRASTTWLARMLEQSPDCHVARGKELHYWTLLENPKSRADLIAKRRRNVARAARDILLSAAAPGRAAAAYGLLRIRLAEHALAVDPSVDNYLRLLMKGWRGQPVAGELTPVYCLLSETSLSRMAALHPGARFVFVMRDPVARLWSGVKQRYQTDSRPTAAVHADIVAQFERAVRDPASVQFRLSDYRTTVPKLDRAVPPDRVSYHFHESLRQPQETARLARFLGLPAVPAEGERRVNAGRHETLTMPANLAAEAERALGPTYAFVADRFGAEVPQAWGMQAVA